MKTAYEYFQSGTASYPKLSEKTGLNPSYICNAIRGRIPISFAKFLTITRALLMPDVEAEQEWMKRKKDQAQNEIDKQLS